MPPCSGQITTLCFIGLVVPPLKDSHRTAAFRTSVPQVRTLPPLEYHYFFQYLLSRAPPPGISAHRIHIGLGIGEGLILCRADCVPSYKCDSLLSRNPALSVSVVDLTDHWEFDRSWNSWIASKGRLPTSAAAEYVALFSNHYQFLHFITALSTLSPHTLCLTRTDRSRQSRVTSPVSSTRYCHPVLDDGYQIEGGTGCGTGCFQYRSGTG